MKILLLSSVVLFIAITGTRAAVHYTGQPSFCENCHIMKPYYDSWSKSARDKKINCYTCHTENSTLGLVKAKVNGLRDVYLTVMNIPTQPKDERAFDYCTECHQQVKTIQTKDLRFNHLVHTRAGFSCGYCHSGVVHGITDKPKMQFCIACHTAEPNRKAPAANCLACHEKKRGNPPSHSQDSWSVTHGQAFLKESKYCTICHEKGPQQPLCQKCHKVEMPHPKNWMTTHTEQPNSAQTSCLNCHKYDSKPRKAVTCQSCHGVKMPHPADWLTSHGSFANNSTCSYCHTRSNPARPDAAWADPAYCVNCHTTENPHPPNWVNKHGTKQFSINRCSLCHNTTIFCSRCHSGE